MNYHFWYQGLIPLEYLITWLGWDCVLKYLLLMARVFLFNTHYPLQRFLLLNTCDPIAEASIKIIDIIARLRLSMSIYSCRKASEWNSICSTMIMTKTLFLLIKNFSYWVCFKLKDLKHSRLDRRVKLVAVGVGGFQRIRWRIRQRR
jgi:hypothetical protein